MIWHAPSGDLVTGHVLDVNVRAFNRALRDYDSELYTKWSPKKLGGWGCWEIWRKPTRKVAVYKGTHKGTAFYSLESISFDSLHHVLDCAFLNYDALRRIRAMDNWENPTLLRDIDKRESDREAREKREAKAHLTYAIKQNMSAMRDIYEAVRSGVHPAEVLLSTEWVMK